MGLIRPHVSVTLLRGIVTALLVFAMAGFLLTSRTTADTRASTPFEHRSPSIAADDGWDEAAEPEVVS